MPVEGVPLGAVHELKISHAERIGHERSVYRLREATDVLYAFVALLRSMPDRCSGDIQTFSGGVGRPYTEVQS